MALDFPLLMEMMGKLPAQAAACRGLNLLARRI
jgi:hypothetical protein